MTRSTAVELNGSRNQILGRRFPFTPTGNIKRGVTQPELIGPGRIR